MNKFFLATLSSILFFASCSQFGENPSGDHLEEIKKSPNYDIEINRFKNLAKVKGANIQKKHKKPTKENKGGIVSKEGYVHLSNLRKVEDLKKKVKK